MWNLRRRDNVYLHESIIKSSEIVDERAEKRKLHTPKRKVKDHLLACIANSAWDISTLQVLSAHCVDLTLLCHWHYHRVPQALSPTSDGGGRSQISLTSCTFLGQWRKGGAELTPLTSCTTLGQWKTKEAQTQSPLSGTAILGQSILKFR